MSDEYNVPDVELEPGELPLMILVVTTRGVHVEPLPALGVVSWEAQVRVARDIAAAVRDVAEQIEARAGLVDAVKEAMDP